MKVLTISSLELLEPEVQKDVHYILRMEHHTDYVFTENNTKQYSCTISMQDTESVIDFIINKTTELSEYTFILDNLDTENRKIQRIIVKNGSILNKHEGTWEWDA